MWNVARAFTLGPLEAWKQLGGGPLTPREAHLLTYQVMEAGAAQQAQDEVERHKGKGNAPNLSASQEGLLRSLLKLWSENGF